MKNVAFPIQYAGLSLLPVQCDQGWNVTPLKPIVGTVGCSWDGQRKKLLRNAFAMRRFGICFLPKNDESGIPRYAGSGYFQPSETDDAPDLTGEIYIRIDRVAGYLMTINPEQVRAQGNESGADFLERKIAEWDDALHDYEELGIAINLEHARIRDALRRERISFFAACKIKNGIADPSDRNATEHILRAWAGELGAPYQPDLLDKQQEQK
jgi:hypothetical protein